MGKIILQHAVHCVAPYIRQHVQIVCNLQPTYPNVSTTARIAQQLPMQQLVLCYAVPEIALFNGAMRHFLITIFRNSSEPFEIWGFKRLWGLKITHHTFKAVCDFCNFCSTTIASITYEKKPSSKPEHVLLLFFELRYVYSRPTAPSDALIAECRALYSLLWLLLRAVQLQHASLLIAVGVGQMLLGCSHVIVLLFTLQ